MVTVPLFADALSRSGGADIERIDGIEAAVLQCADVDVRRGGIEGHGHGVGAGDAALMFLA